ncbi:origin recognition complex, subunit 5 [Kipferlia bialata]|uniref:Origin recognition complex, subunit 5 n=1 Tax=Kipferlia bialata TaxID=797122 RepID=A0A9K3D8D9_9EUKA|nr:origin recognition complex, subunit 5 [Kipferlia bialata]|eukprot:g11559.t1
MARDGLMQEVTTFHAACRRPPAVLMCSQLPPSLLPTPLPCSVIPLSLPVPDDAHVKAISQAISADTPSRMHFAMLPDSRVISHTNQGGASIQDRREREKGIALSLPRVLSLPTPEADTPVQSTSLKTVKTVKGVEGTAPTNSSTCLDPLPALTKTERVALIACYLASKLPPARDTDTFATVKTDRPSKKGRRGGRKINEHPKGFDAQRAVRITRSLGLRGWGNSDEAMEAVLALMRSGLLSVSPMALRRTFNSIKGVKFPHSHALALSLAHTIDFPLLDFLGG